MKQQAGFLFTILIIFWFSITAFSQTKERTEIEDAYKWDMEEIYPSVDSWRADQGVFREKAANLVEYRGKLCGSASDLLAGLKAMEDMYRVYMRLRIYTFFLSSLDQRNQEYTALGNEIGAEEAMFSEVTAFIHPEILSAGPDLIRQYIGEEPRLMDYDAYIHDLFRQNEHVLSEKEEQLLGYLSISNRRSDDIFNTLQYSDIQYPQAMMSDGEAVVLDPSTLSRYLSSENRDDRKLAQETFWKEMNKYRNTFGQLLVHKLSGENMLRKARKYESTLEMSLDQSNIPVEIYHSLIRNTNRYMDAHHRYWNLKKKLLEVDTIYMYDLFAPAVQDVKLQYSYQEAQDLVLEALQPLGEEYTATVRRAFNDRWIDVYPSVGKWNGAFSSGSLAYDLHPYILLNYLGYYRDVSTLTHELGHTMHSYYSAQNQSYQESAYSSFIAEVPSTINSILLVSSMLDKDLDENTRLALLMNYLDEYVASIFRQVMYAEFELSIHEKTEKGEALTADIISEIFGGLSRKYYGHDEGISNIEEKYDAKWCTVGHFYGYTYYVYVYSTSFVASVTIADKILSGEEDAVDKFIELISAGGSDYPVSLLNEAGVDLTGPEPFEYAMKNMYLLMDQVDEILDARE